MGHRVRPHAARAGRARAFVEQDPLFVDGLRAYEVRGWQLNEGRIVLTLDLDANRAGIA
ncbi:hypothetical protein [Kutzneria sp. 744]|uniref:hypothetical protein n=1 Tax=Kutzneria sp. (strain 744) TaxID=345341 RepID=UPI0003EEB93F|nr:hypothetical protein [Kutzneria sp. 744]EWM11951.1 hypothetical protein KUTG_02255 [Kutzneria sp. 744]